LAAVFFDADFAREAGVVVELFLAAPVFFAADPFLFGERAGLVVDTLFAGLVVDTLFAGLPVFLAPGLVAAEHERPPTLSCSRGRSFAR
jgi:hypothetical protein